MKKVIKRKGDNVMEAKRDDSNPFANWQSSKFACTQVLQIRIETELITIVSIKITQLLAVG